MILKEIQVSNIRSYVELPPFEFTEGTSLFYGGVGSGKSSLLYAIEFALFGLGELKGPDLLRNDAAEGLVSLTFEEDGKRYSIYRKLRRKGAAVSQAEGAISEDGVSYPYAVTEMKLRVLDILKLNEKPQPGTSSIIYRYGIFTPQEEIKRIMEASAEGRLETLRRAFRLEKYATVRDGAQMLSTYLEKVEIKVLEKEIEGLHEKKSGRDSLTKQIEMNNNQLLRLGSELGEIDAALSMLHDSEKQLEEDLREIQSSQAQIPLIKEQCEHNEQLVTRLKDELAKMGEERSKLTSELKQLQSLARPTDQTQEQLEVKLKEVKEEQKALASRMGADSKSLDNYEMLIDEKVCPTCERPIDDPSIYEEKRNKMREEMNNLLNREKEIEDESRSLESLLQDLRQYDTTTQHLPQMQEGIDGRAKSMDEKAREIERVEIQLKKSQKRLSQLEEVVKSNEKLLKEFNQTKQQIEERGNLRHSKDKDIALLKQNNAGLEENRGQLESEIKKAEVSLVRIGTYREVNKYLELYFIPTIERIERIVLQRIHEDFNDAFQRYFSMIIGFTEIEAYIDEDFSVVIIQGGYETPYNRLSGGERTSLALAYRLALNRLIRKLSKLERGLLILDEPTEGLSYTQVLNLREVFDELDCNQIVLVSHESQFLGFSDRVFRVDKVNHATIVSPL